MCNYGVFVLFDIILGVNRFDDIEFDVLVILLIKD